ncbi:opacity family porin [Algisphaera agarilytica]|uniref:Porin opacity type domain-containing protein n=1 Tax=Algisphaera agarilytica TaxID=1385975 RepID=A0A7X0H3N7_9BACT|nr:opacity family porin [Algisphaera agarilytica]MBB6428488.1 hypothetical protein [Algisphaera agarilytica]
MAVSLGGASLAQSAGVQAAGDAGAWSNALALGVASNADTSEPEWTGQDLLGDRQDVWGYYFRGSLMGVEPTNDVRARSDGQRVDTDDGFGLTAAAGFKMDYLPLAWEFEYMFRRFSHDSYTDPVAGFVSDNDVSLHTFAINVLYDQSNLLGPVGVYAGGGVGFRLSSFSFSSGSGGSESSISGDGLFIQAMAGVTVTIDPNLQLYGGVRYTDSGKIRNEFLEVDTAAVGGEIGLRVYF